MKIALVSPYDYLYPGGVNNHIAYLLHNFRQQGIDAHVIATIPPGHSAPPHTIPLDGRLVTLKSGGSLSRVNLGPVVVRHVRRLLQLHQFDIVHLHNPLSPLINPAFLVNRAVAPATAFVATFHEQRSTPNRAIELGKPIFRRWINGLDGRIAVSKAALDFNRPLFPGQYTIIPNGVDVNRFAKAGKKDGLPTDRMRPTILFAGRLEARKGFCYLLQAYRQIKAQMPKVRLQVIGPHHSEQLDEIQKYINRYQMKDIMIAGQVSEEALPTFFHSADLFSAPSVDFESFGIVLLEAMAAGTPIVASDIPGYREVMQNGRFGRLVEPKNPGALAAALLQLLQNPEERARIAEAAQRHVQSFDWRIVAGNVLDFYEDVLSQKVRP